MEDMACELEELFCDRGEPCAKQQGEGSDSTTVQWVHCIRDVFYDDSIAARGANKFAELEETLTLVFGRLSRSAGAAFWDFAVCVLLILAHETKKQAERRVTPSSTGRGKKKKKVSQPNAPLAFVMVNALRRLMDDEYHEQQQSWCQAQGQNNAALREFCLLGLRGEHPVDQKLVVEMVDLFDMRDLDPQAIRSAAWSLLDARKYTALIRLYSTFGSIEWPFEETIKSMARSKDWSAAELLVRTFRGLEGKDLGKVLVEEAISLQEFKRAHRIVYNFSLQEDYPDVELLYCRDGLMKLIERQRWQMALSFAGNDASLQKMLFDHLVAAGEVQWAAQLAQVLGVPDFEACAAQMIARRDSLAVNGLLNSADAAALDGCWDLKLQGEDVVFCSTEQALQKTMNHFFLAGEGAGIIDAPAVSNDEGRLCRFAEIQIVGIDVEWKPTSTKIAAASGSTTTTAIASILQIASSSHVFIIDLLELHDNDFLFDVFLERLFHSPMLLKVGFGFSSDLKVLHQTFPERSAFLSVSPFLELSTVASKLPGVSAVNSLSNAVNHILGKPLDKRMQMSNWDTRPLSSAQTSYAALDAYCLVEIVAKLMENVGGAGDSELPPWEETEVCIGKLVHSSPISGKEAVEAIALREEHHEEWIELKVKTSPVEEAAGLLTPQAVTDYWEMCKALRLQRQGEVSNDDELDTELQFIRSQSVKELLQRSQDSKQPPNFLALNCICFFAGEMPCVACIDASCKLDTAQLASLCGVSRRRIKLATPLECCEHFGFAPGTVPPFGHRRITNGVETPVQIFASETLKYVEYLVCGGGSPGSLLWLQSKAFFALVEIVAVGEIQRGTSATEAPSSGTRACAALQKQPVASHELKFLADSMVARVGKWLRTIGMDVVVWDPYAVPKKTASQDHKAALLALALRDQRILLTRDKKLANRRDAGACFVVSSDDPFQQFQEIKHHFALQLVQEDMMSRCARCNAKGFGIVDLDYVRTQTEDEVHPNVLEVVTEFWMCRVCHKIYWEGPKYDSSYSNLLRMFEDQSIVAPNKAD